ncbi:MAG: PEP-CTERM sorting domain-containing protein [Candidatus Omnitrophica bacterium]|nr:PEP-CTERM sorting domain-containing protein [Candidatus Omnitrophota bacterium]
MKYKMILTLTAVVLLTIMSTGCQLGGSGGSGGSGFSGSGDGGSAGGSVSGAGSGGIGSSNVPHNPEPATMALVGIGVAGYAWYRRRKK